MVNLPGAGDGRVGTAAVMEATRVELVEADPTSDDTSTVQVITATRMQKPLSDDVRPKAVSLQHDGTLAVGNIQTT